MSQFIRRLRLSVQLSTGRRRAQEMLRSRGLAWTRSPVVRDSAGSHRIMGRAAAALACLTVWLLLNVVSVEAKRKHTPVVPPDLKILSVVVSPESFTPGESSLSFIIEVELPKELAGSTLLEISSLISSPSKSSLRFLTSRQPVGAGGARGPVALPDGEPVAGPEAVGASEQSVGGPEHESPEFPDIRMTITLTWDGNDQTGQRVQQGRFDYEVRAKLLVVGENGPRTQMVSWPKRGTIEVK